MFKFILPLLLLALSTKSPAQTALPTLLEFFSVKDNRIAWSVQKSVDLMAFTLEYSPDGRSWSAYAQLPKRDGYGDTVVGHLGFYRLYIPGGSTSYSNTVQVNKTTAADTARVYTLQGQYIGTVGAVRLQVGERYIIRWQRAEVIHVTD